MTLEAIGWRLQGLIDSIPGYRDYRALEDRQDADKRLRLHLASQYDAQRERLARLQQEMVSQGRLEGLDLLEGAMIKLQRFIDRLRTASYGYAGWFLGPVIQEADLAQLVAFDSALADGVAQVAGGIDGVASAVKTGQGLVAAVADLGATLDGLNTRFDGRQELLSRGKRLPPAELARVLQPPQPPSELEKKLSQLKLNDAVTYAGADYLITAKATYIGEGKTWLAYRLEDLPRVRWLRVGDGPVTLDEPVELEVGTPPPAELEVAGTQFRQSTERTAAVTVEGPGGKRRGNVRAWRYESSEGASLLVEDWGDQVQVWHSQAIDPDFLKLWPRK